MKELTELKSRFPKAVKVALITDSNVDRYHGDRVARELEASGLRVERIVFPAGERSKNLETYAELVRGLAALRFARSDIAVALGGGVVGDMGGFAAATYMRGIEVIQVPTTLLAMVDSSIGGKTGVDIPEGKNLVGAFHQPAMTLRDVSFLETLPKRELKNGYAEAIKTAVLFDPELFGRLKALEYRGDGPVPAELADIIERCAQHKIRVVEEDFRETGKRKLLNLGHTFGHAIEKVSDFAIPHGEAVAMGMRIVGRDVPEIGEILDAYGFGSLEACAGLDKAAILDAMRNDKKRVGNEVTLVVPRKIGACELVKVPVEELGKWL